MQTWTKLRSSIFEHPKRTSGVVWATSTFIFLFPTCIELIPLGNSQRNAKGQRDAAQNAYDETLRELGAINMKIREARQRIIDLGCAMSGYQRFNQGVMAFRNSIDDSGATPMERLKLFWQMHFDPDRTETEKSVAGKSWDEDSYEYDYYYSCAWLNCGQNTTCCYDWGYHWVTHTYYYNEITTILDKYQGIIQGTPLHLTPLDCGYYSRQFGATSPVTYMTYESPHIKGGDRRAGTTYVDFYREYSCDVTASFALDDTVTDFKAKVLRIADQNQAATDLAAKLYGFLGTAIAAFNMAGANYSAVQDGIRRQIPTLLDQAAAVNTTLQEQAVILAAKKTEFGEADGDLDNGLSLWLPLLFLIPGGLALLTWYFLVRCNPRLDASDAVGYARVPPDEGEPDSQTQSMRLPPPAYYNPAHFQRGDIEQGRDPQESQEQLPYSCQVSPT